MEDATTPPETPTGRQAADDLRSLLRDLGADDQLVKRVHRWADLGQRGHVYVPPLPADVVQRLVDGYRGSPVMSRLYCREHHGWVREHDAVYMGAAEGISGPGTARYVCVPCVREQGLVPPAAGFVGHPSAPPKLAGGAG